jgi:hypothetical protein
VQWSWIPANSTARAQPVTGDLDPGTEQDPAAERRRGIGHARPEEPAVHRRRPTALVLLSAAAATVAALPPASAATADSLPTVTSGQRPGPDVLYADAPRAPQLENRDPRFRAAPLLVSSADAYVDGEYLYQDYLFDDYGADTDRLRGGSQSERSGDLDPPADEVYAGNAADLVEVRIAPGPTDVKYRITLNSLVREDTAIVALAFDTDGDEATGSDTLPRDPGAPFPGTDEVVTVWGSGAEHSALTASGEPRTTPVDARADLEANQLTVTVPRSVSDPRGVWRTTVAAGVHDAETGGWMDLGGPNAILNLAFRGDEPVQTTNTPPDVNQSIALSEDDPTRYARDIDFAALDARTDRSTVPATGRQIRLFPSRLGLPEGRDLSAFPQYRGQLQPYSLYVPTTYAAATPAGLTLSLHSLGQHYWQYQGGRLFEQQGEERGNLVLSPMAHGPDGWYQREAEYDVFEAWNDVARHFALDPDRAYASGYSMGGYGTYRLVGLYPDLFAAAFTVVGPPGDGIWVPPLPPTGGAETLSNLWLENVRSVPFMNLAAAEDELVPVVGPRAQNLGAPEQGVRGFEQLGYRYRFLAFPAAEHFTLAVLGYDFPAARDHLGDRTVDRDPARVSFGYVPASDAPDMGLVHDHAYWVSGVRLTDAEGLTAKGLVDARSRAFGVADPATKRVQGAGVMQLPYTEIGLDWLEPEPAAAENALELALSNVSSATLDLRRARLDARTPLTVQASADGASSVVLVGDFPAGVAVTQDGQPVDGVRAADGTLTIPVAEGEHTYVIAAAAVAPGPSVPPAGAAPDGAAPGSPGTAPAGRLAATGAMTVLPALGLLVLGAAGVLRAGGVRRLTRAG